MASYEQNVEMPADELSAECALYLYDHYFRPLFGQYMMALENERLRGCRETKPLTQQQFFRAWIEHSNEGQAYLLIVEAALNPVKVRAYMMKYGGY